jgi:acetyltransferase
MVEIDGACSIALVACLPESEELLGIARADMDPRCGACELGITIAEGWQGKRIGSLLLEQSIRFARLGGFRSLFAHVLSTNLRMQRLLRRQGFSCSGDPGGPLTFRLPLVRDNA